MMMRPAIKCCRLKPRPRDEDKKKRKPKKRLALRILDLKKCHPSIVFVDEEIFTG